MGSSVDCSTDGASGASGERSMFTEYCLAAVLSQPTMSWNAPAAMSTVSRPLCVGVIAARYSHADVCVSAVASPLTTVKSSEEKSTVCSVNRMSMWKGPLWCEGHVHLPQILERLRQSNDECVCGGNVDGEIDDGGVALHSPVHLAIVGALGLVVQGRPLLHTDLAGGRVDDEGVCRLAGQCVGQSLAIVGRYGYRGAHRRACGGVLRDAPATFLGVAVRVTLREICPP